MNSCLYECAVMHHRLAPKVHQFSYRIFLFSLDLDEIDELARRIFGFSRNRTNFYDFRDGDHLAPGPGSVREKLIAYLASQNVPWPEGGRVQLVTLPRVLGYVFNPVSFYFCFDASGTPFASVAEVSNTFKEMKLFLLRPGGEDGRFRLVTPKHFYVSPFSSLDLEFDFKLRVPGETLEIHIDDRDAGRPVLVSALTGRRVALTSARLAWMTLKYPLITLRVIFLIHWHALLLWLKRIPWFAKTADPHRQRDVLRPHSSLVSRNP